MFIRQTIIGIIFGLCAIFATEFGAVEINGAALNCRDAASIIAGLMFGPWSGILAGLIGGIERFVASYHGIGVYTQVACTLGCFFAGFASAFIKHLFFRRRRATVLHAFVLTLFVEAVHMGFVPLTHMDDILQATMVMYRCFIPLLFSNSVGVVVAFVTTSVIYQRRLGYSFKDIFLRRQFYFRHDLFYSFQFWLLLVVVVCFGASMAVVSITIDNLNFKDIEDNYKNSIRTVSMVVENDSKNYSNSKLLCAIEISNIWCQQNMLDQNQKFTTWYMVSGLDYQPLAGNEAYYGLSQKIKNLPENTLCYVDCVNSSTGNNESLTVLYQKQADYIAIIFQLEKNSMYLTHVSAAICMSLEIIIFAFLMIIIFILLRRLVSNNINRVNNSLVKITKGDLNERVKVYSHAEFALLSDSINSTVDKLKNYIDAESNRFKKDFEMAKLIQSSALPNIFPEDEAFDMFATNKSAKEVGGDFYDFYEIDKNQLGFLIADVSGKGIAAAMIMMKAKSILQESMKETTDPCEIMERANKFLCQDNEAGMFVTCWLGILNVKTGELKYTSAGHNPAILMPYGRSADFINAKSGLVLGAIDTIKYKTHTININYGDLIFIYTDGITEANNIDMELYSEDRLIKVINESKELPSKVVCEKVIDDVDKFVNGVEQADDQTLLGLRYLYHPKREV